MTLGGTPVHKRAWWVTSLHPTQVHGETHASIAVRNCGAISVYGAPDVVTIRPRVETIFTCLFGEQLPLIDALDDIIQRGLRG